MKLPSKTYETEKSNNKELYMISVPTRYIHYTQPSMKLPTARHENQTEDDIAPHTEAHAPVLHGVSSLNGLCMLEDEKGDVAVHHRVHEGSE